MSYISSLNLLNSDSPAPITEDTFSDDLSLWANAQFTFDCAPGSALIEEDKKQENETLLSSLSDFNLEQQQQQQQQQSINTPSYISTLLSQVQQQQTIPQTTINQINLPRIAPATEQFQSTAALQVGDTGVAKVKIETINNNNNNKRPSQQEQEDTSHTLSPEDDKRRRNTAASARFRQKKKLREQALEQTAKEMSTKCDTLEKRVRELEMEAKWLRALVIEKNPSLLSDKSSVAVADEPSPSSTS